MRFCTRVVRRARRSALGANQLTESRKEMSEFRIHHLVSELISLFQVEGGDSPDTFVELLSRNMTPYVTTQVSAYTAKRSIASFSSQGEKFLKMYDKLKSKQVKHLDPLIYLLSEVLHDAQLCQFLKDHCTASLIEEIPSVTVERIVLPHGEELRDLPKSGTVVSVEEFNQLRGRIESFTRTANEREEKRRSRGRSEEGNIPTIPKWVETRRHLLLDFGPSIPHSKQPVPLGSLPVAAQEVAIVQDLLFLLVGVEGKYISVKPLKDKMEARSFSLDKSLDPSLQSLVMRILPHCSNFSIVSQFMDEYSKLEHGMVSQALCAAMHTIRKEYLILVAQLEQQAHINQLSILKLWHYVQPCSKMMDILSSIALSIEQAGCHGGAILSILHTKAMGMAGDKKAQDLCVHLTQAACVPFLEMIQLWIYQGTVSDPYKEFMVHDNKHLQKNRLTDVYNDSYWEERYTIHSEMIPSFMEKVAEKILHTGKYLNVIKECGLELNVPNAEELVYSLNDRKYIDQIDQACQHSSRLLIDLLIKEKDIIGRLISLKHFFLLDQADVLVHFMDMAESELQKNNQDISLGLLESLLDLAIRSSTLASDPYRDNLKICLIPYDLVTQLFLILSIEPEIIGAGPSLSTKPAPVTRPKETKLPGLRSFTLDYSVEWPVSLVISRKTLTKYQLLFRHIFYCRYIEQQLGRVWLNQKALKVPISQVGSTIAFSLRQRMLNFVQNYQYYMTFEVLEPNWCMMEQKLREAITIDVVLQEHNDFLDRCLKDCMLTNSEVLRIVSRILTLCLTFSTILLHHAMPPSSRESSADISTADDEETKEIKRIVEVSHVNLDATLLSLDREFSSSLVQLLDLLNVLSTKHCEHYMSSMIGRLDYNGFYTTQLEETQTRRLSSSTPA